MAIDNDRINELINRLSDKDLEIVNDLIERLAQLNNFYDVPIDDEPTTDEDLKAIKEAHEAYENGGLVDLKDIENELRN